MASRTALRNPVEQPRLLLSRKEAAATLGISMRHFERYVQAYVPCVYLGQLRLYEPGDLARWAKDHKTARPHTALGNGEHARE
ncbi:MAG: hypothetical protein ACRDK7_14755 [Solirubrobacteraceae bacterium]